MHFDLGNGFSVTWKVNEDDPALTIEFWEGDDLVVSGLYMGPKAPLSLKEFLGPVWNRLTQGQQVELVRVLRLGDEEQQRQNMVRLICERDGHRCEMVDPVVDPARRNSVTYFCGACKRTFVFDGTDLTYQGPLERAE
jgi:hypothetical protein